MSQVIEFLTPRMVGPRFAEHAIPLELLKDLAVLEEMIIEVAKWCYLQDHPERKRSPKGFTDGVALKLSGVGFILDRLPGFFLYHVWREATALHHEPINDAVEDSAVVKACFHILQKVFYCFWGLAAIQLQHDISQISYQPNTRMIIIRPGELAQAKHKGKQ